MYAVPAGSDAPAPRTPVQVGSLILDFSVRDAQVGDLGAHLTATEFQLLASLAEKAGQVLSREDLFERVWGYDISFNSNSLDVFIYRLRSKLAAIGAPKIIMTSRGLGYRLNGGPG